jgi:hypothetical protein
VACNSQLRVALPSPMVQKGYCFEVCSHFFQSHVLSVPSFIIHTLVYSVSLSLSLEYTQNIYDHILEMDCVVGRGKII